MLFALTALAVSLVLQDACASPVAPFAPTVESTHVAVTTNFPHAELNSVAGVLNLTRSANGVHTDTTQAEFPASLVFFSGTQCTGTASSVDLSTLAHARCFPTPSYNSLAIVQPSNEGLLFGVFVGPGTQCASLTQIPSVNTCFNTPSGFQSLAALP